MPTVRPWVTLVSLRNAIYTPRTVSNRLDAVVTSRLDLLTLLKSSIRDQPAGTLGSKDLYQHHVPREWLTSMLICDDCGREYPEDRDECPDCGCLDAELVDTGGGPGRFWATAGYARFLLSVKSPRMWGSLLGARCVAGTAPRA